MKVTWIAWVNLRRLARQRTTIFFLVALPIILILVVGLATERFEDTDIPLGVVQESADPSSDDLVGLLIDLPGVSVETFDDATSMRRAVRRGSVEAGIVVPERFGTLLRSGVVAEVVFVADVARGFPAPLRSAVAAVVAEQARPVQAARFATSEVGGRLEANLAVADELSASVPPLAVMTDDVGESDRVFFGTGFGYQAPANLVLFVFITSAAAAAMLIETRRLELSRRMLGTPTSARTILAGEALGRFAIALVQAAIIYLAGALVFGVSWGDPVGSVTLIVTFVLVGTAVGMLFGTLFRTPEQAGAIGPPVGIGLGMLGGCMWPLEIVPEPMRVIGHLFPHAWAMDAWVELTAFGGGIETIFRELAVLGVFAAVLLSLATWRLGRIIAAG